jgi:alkanesulfonate monooxygenase SsuD/methylene tetrahydromethanopterin reductase-like flavin-dependent oxidoreductase (luciferase family)
MGAGFGWNTDELADHNVPANKRRTVLREYLEAMRALWSQDEASYAGEYVNFGASWAWPKPVRRTVPVLIGASATEKTLAWIAANADGWITTPRDNDEVASVARLHEAWQAAGRAGTPRVIALDGKPDAQRLAEWHAGGITDALYGMPDRDASEIPGYLDRLRGKLDAMMEA